MPSTRIELLQGMPIFGALREHALECLLEQARTVEVAAGECFFREGDSANSVFVLEQGQALVLKSWRGRELVLNTLASGDCFGELALMDLQPRSATVRAERPCRAIEICSDDLMRLYERDLEQFTLLQMNIGREVCRRLRATDERLFSSQMGEPPPFPWADLGAT